MTTPILKFIDAAFYAVCRSCEGRRDFEITVSPDSHPELPLGDGIELAMHEHLDAEGWVDGLCPFCARSAFLKTEPEEVRTP